VKKFWFEVRERDSGRWLWVEAAFQPPRCGERDRFGLPLEPDEPAQLRIVRAEDRRGAKVAHRSMEAELMRTARALLGF